MPENHNLEDMQVSSCQDSLAILYLDYLEKLENPIPLVNLYPDCLEKLENPIPLVNLYPDCLEILCPDNQDNLASPTKKDNVLFRMPRVPVNPDLYLARPHSIRVIPKLDPDNM